MKYIALTFIVFLSLICFMAYSLAGGWTIKNVSDNFRVLKYNGSKVAELTLKSRWEVRCFSRKRGNSSTTYDDLRTATKSAMSKCRK